MQGLTPHQMDVLMNIAKEGLTARQAAAKMGLKESSVRNLLAFARFKFGAKSNAHLVYLVLVKPQEQDTLSKLTGGR